jgi:biotin carboxyl carrier protein
VALKFLKQEKNYFELELNQKIFQVKVIKFVAAQNLAILQINGQPYKVCVPKDKKIKKSSIACKPESRELEELKFFPAEKLVMQSPLAGRITKVLVKSGQAVVQNQAIVSIESMKMENEIRAPFPAFIKNILISEGNLVQQNQVLVTFEKEGEGDAGKLTGQKILQSG